MIRKITILSIIFIISILIIMLVINNNRKQQLTNRLRTRPNCQLYDIDNHIVSLSQFHHQSLLIMVFDPECDHCVYVITQIKEHADQFQAIQVLLITTAEHDTLKQFVHNQGLDRFNQIKVLRCDPNHYEETFGNSVFPTFYLYNNSGQLLKKFSGEVSVENLINHFNNIK
jgi:thioredoxin-related protein